jgi:hypothetical protein
MTMARSGGWLPLVVCVLACQTREPDPSGQAQLAPGPPRQTVIQTTSGEYVSGLPGTMDVYWDTEPRGTLMLSGFRERKMLSIALQFDPTSASEGLIAAASAGGLANGVANIGVQSESKMIAQANAGLVTLQVDDKRIAGEGELSPEALSFTVDAALVVSCWVPRSTLTPDAMPLTVDAQGDTNALVQDTQFSTPKCQTFRDW